MKTRIYIVEGKSKATGNVSLVRAASRASALRHVAEKTYKADVASQDDLVNLASAGTKVEDMDSEEKDA